jgi:hypothetical protein
LSGKREKKSLAPKIKSTEKKTTEPVEEKTQNKTKSVGWQYRYRVSKMRDAQKHNKSSKKQDQKSSHEQLDPELAPRTSDEKNAGWEYRSVFQHNFIFFHSLFSVIVFDVNLIHQKMLPLMRMAVANVRKNRQHQNEKEKKR